MMLHFSCDEHHAPCGYLVDFLGNFEAGSSPDNVIDLIFVVRSLQVRCTGGEDVEAGAHRRHAKKFAVRFTAPGPLLLDLGDGGKERFHAKMPPKMRSVNCGMRFCACKSPAGLYHW